MTTEVMKLFSKAMMPRVSRIRTEGEDGDPFGVDLYIGLLADVARFFDELEDVLVGDSFSNTVRLSGLDGVYLREVPGPGFSGWLKGLKFWERSANKLSVSRSGGCVPGLSCLPISAIGSLKVLAGRLDWDPFI